MRFSRRLLGIGAVAAVLLSAGAVAYAADALPFSDIAGHWAQDEIVRVAGRGIVEGHNDGTFGPDEFVTRAQMAVFMDREAAEESKPIDARRGCPDCHQGKYSLKHEAVEKGGAVHESLADEADINVCLACHAPGTGDREGKGVVAPLSLRDIVHPVHMGSKTFTGHYMGNCFTCHNVDGEGAFQVLSQAVDTDSKGVPDVAPIPGAQDSK
ncbi:MAG: S-layer homology domain-containing protein [Thermoleophilia bacterium]|nr:S-layer homology domain-containing protein [Thermoleophilia bacterium]